MQQAVTLFFTLSHYVQSYNTSLTTRGQKKKVNLLLSLSR